MSTQLTERSVLKVAIVNADIVTDRTSAWFDAKGFRRFRAAALSGSVASTKVATLQILQAQDSSGTGAKALSALASHTGSGGGTPAILEVEAKQESMDADGGFTHIAVRLTSDNSAALIAAACLELADPVFKPASV